ncbi:MULTISPECIES: tRNA uridine-5-carboxymethylaminomethyl(34) synthesis GTPase MnmE [Methylorubrum]|uniref:tRNA uridine-5-carboxymethylaminomethyl(34) synthesis GTPase MnmE n=1 Tax=Methylorubrum TaxID=2282523 RepID=UPI00209DC04F|nr:MULTISPECIES: tRNA uridine-5-carboxymethylaminomethyl(34) synthesis GTPase MnmE [Methylorubrum]MCP1547656.1 tRNA modification GTPase [Methylorubrum zatmanii]MCP1555728.1 tRNA modification GTPase [Methylorubrum extorquens]MCP1577959.1 tRNA modification GTPase [Methylorubrum extorquens]
MPPSLPDRDDTIFAPASGFGRAAVTVVRISGPAAGLALDRLAGGRPEPRRLSLRRLRDPDSRDILDQALAAWLPGPATATGEDMAELHLHGGLAVRSAVLGALGRVPGCRPAEAGAFSRRAFLNGRIDLTEAEGIADLIDAETEAQRVQALRQLDGALGRQVATWRETGIDLLAGAEAALDFADEGDVDEDGLDAALSGRAAALRDAIRAALADGRRGERLREGFCVVLAGAPNAGKSTLLNALSGRDAAIVSDIPGTTRDAIEVRCDLGGLPAVLVDTAGLRETADAIEAEGVKRTQSRIRTADLVLHLVPTDGNADTGLSADVPILLVRTKTDLAPEVSGAGGVAVSAVTGAGLDALLDAIQAAAQTALGQGDALVTRERHREALSRAADHLDRVATASVGFPPELMAEDLRLAVRALGEVGGHVGVEELLDRLFSGFCIGK